MKATLIPLLLVVLSLTGCTDSQSQQEKTQLAAYQEAIQSVLDRYHEVFAETEADTYNSAVLRKRADLMDDISLTGCPTDFTLAFEDYCQELASTATYAEYAEARAKEFDSGAKIFESAVRGFFGDGGTIAEASQLKDELQKGFLEHKDAQDRAEREVKKMCVKYGFR